VRATKNTENSKKDRKLALLSLHLLFNLIQVYFTITLWKLRSNRKQWKTQIGYLHDQNKSGFFGGQAFIRPIRAIWKVIKELCLARKRPALQKSHFCFHRLTFIKKFKNALFERKKMKEKKARFSSSVGSSKRYLSPALFQTALLFVTGWKIKQ